MKTSNSVSTIILAGSLLLQLSTLCFQSRGAAGDVDLSFDPGSGVNGLVNAVAVQPDGKLIIGGEFTTVKGLARSKMARLNADGSGDSSFNAGSVTDAWGQYMRAVVLQADGKALVGYDYGIGRLNSDGSLDTNFNASITIYDFDSDSFYAAAVRSAVVQSDGKVIIGGDFTTVNGTNRPGIARLNADGSLDNSFDAGTGIYGTAHSLALQSARLNANGCLDSSFNPGTGAGGYSYGVSSVTVQSDGKVLIAGDFLTVNGTNRNSIARLNANGSLDSSFNPETAVYNNNPRVASVAEQSDGKILIGGAFNTVTSSNGIALARLNANGSLDSSFNTGAGPAGYVLAVALQSDGKALIGGVFASVNGTNRNRIARLNADGSLDDSFQPGRGVSSVSSFVVQPDGKMLIGGVFTFINGTNQYGSTRLNADGSLDSSFVPGSFNPFVGLTGVDYLGADSLAVQPDGKVLIGGYTATTITIDEFDNHYYSFGCFVSRVNADGSRDTNFSLAVGGYTSGWGGRDPWSPTVRALATQADGKVLVGGIFGTLNGTNRYGIARLNANGTLDASFNPGIYGVDAIVLQPDGKVLIGGAFITFTNRFGIARLNANGTLDNSFDPGKGANGVSSIALQPDGKVLIGGGFTTVNGMSRNRIARLNANGSLDSSFNPGTGADGIVRSIKLQPDGNLVIGGDFLTVNGVVRPYLARLYGDPFAPSLNIVRSNASVIVSWPVTALNFQLQGRTNLFPTAWSPVAQPTVTNAGQISVTVPATVARKFFRLKSQ
jgi:uncharacterized delta-60 repeat protein